MKKLVIIPTFNEIENIQSLTQEIFEKLSDVHILVVDDSSPDGTGELVHKLSQKNSKLHLLSRKKKEGLGKAYLAGFQWGIENDFDCLIEMDADFSHRPEDLVQIVHKISKFKSGQSNEIEDSIDSQIDFVVGSRYVVGGKTVNWGVLRKFISRGGSLYSRIILGYPINDWTGGFNAWKRSTLEKIELSKVRSNGYSFQIELKYRALKAGCQGVEVPIIFEDRRIGKSKMSLKIVIEAFWRVWKIRFL